MITCPLKNLGTNLLPYDHHQTSAYSSNKPYLFMHQIKHINVKYNFNNFLSISVKHSFEP